MNLGDPERARRSKASRRERERQARADLRAVLAMPEGRRYVYRLMDRCGLHGSVYRATARETDMQLGLQLLGVQIRDEVEAIERGLYGEMRAEFMREGSDERRDDDDDRG